MANGDDIVATTPDGVEHVFPAGTPREVVDRAVKKYLGKEDTGVDLGELQARTMGQARATAAAPLRTARTREEFTRSLTAPPPVPADILSPRLGRSIAESDAAAIRAGDPALAAPATTRMAKTALDYGRAAFTPQGAGLMIAGAAAHANPFAPVTGPLFDVGLAGYGGINALLNVPGALEGKPEDVENFFLNSALTLPAFRSVRPARAAIGRSLYESSPFAGTAPGPGQYTPPGISPGGPIPTPFRPGVSRAARGIGGTGGALAGAGIGGGLLGGPGGAVIGATAGGGAGGFLGPLALRKTFPPPPSYPGAFLPSYEEFAANTGKDIMAIRKMQPQPEEFFRPGGVPPTEPTSRGFYNRENPEPGTLLTDPFGPPEPGLPGAPIAQTGTSIGPGALFPTAAEAEPHITKARIQAGKDLMAREAEQNRIDQRHAQRMSDIEEARQQEIADWAKLDKVSEADHAAFQDRMSGIEDARQRELADYERLKEQHAQSLMRRGDPFSPEDVSTSPFDLTRSGGNFPPRPLTPLVATPEEVGPLGKTGSLGQRMFNMEKLAKDLGMYSAAYGKIGKPFTYGERAGRAISKPVPSAPVPETPSGTRSTTKFQPSGEVERRAAGAERPGQRRVTPEEEAQPPAGTAERRKTVYEMRKGAMETEAEREARQMGSVEGMKAGVSPAERMAQERYGKSWKELTKAQQDQLIAEYKRKNPGRGAPPKPEPFEF